jgi:hypothetical protein
MPMGLLTLARKAFILQGAFSCNSCPHTKSSPSTYNQLLALSAAAMDENTHIQKLFTFSSPGSSLAEKEM